MSSPAIEVGGSGPVRDVELLPTQEDFVYSSAKFRAFIAGVGAGKTWVGALTAIWQLFDGQSGVVVAPTYRMLEDVSLPTLRSILDDWGWSYHYSEKHKRLTLYNGARAYFRSGSDPDRLRGPNLSWFWFDEGALLTEQVWRIILGRIRIGEPKGWITTTPAGFNWLWEKFVDDPAPNMELFQASTRENDFLADGFVEELEANYSAEFAKQEIDGEFVAFEGLVYPELKRGVHIIRPFAIPSSWTRFRMIDFGYTNPFVCLWGALDEDGRAYIVDEHYRSKALIDEHVQAINDRKEDHPKVAWTVADHDAQDRAELNAKGIVTVAAKKPISRGIQVVKARWKVQGDGRPRGFIFSNCVNTIKETGIYRYPDAKKNRNPNENPIDEANHSMDAIRYGFMQLDHGVKPEAVKIRIH